MPPLLRGRDQISEKRAGEFPDRGFCPCATGEVSQFCSLGFDFPRTKDSLMNRAAIACSLLFLFTSPLFASPKSVIAGRVVDSEGAVIANARVLVHWDSSGSTVGLTDN